jgi:hypothetical protein
VFYQAKPLATEALPREDYLQMHYNIRDSKASLFIASSTHAS